MTTEKKKRKKKEKKKKKIKTFLVATNVVASRPPERRPTGTPTARAKRISRLRKLPIFSRTKVSKAVGSVKTVIV